MTKKLVPNLLHKELSYQIHGAAIEVRKDFGPGHKEKLYQSAFAKELNGRIIYSNDRKPFFKKLLVSISLILALIGGVPTVKAAEISLDALTNKLRVSDEFRIDIVLDAGEREINAVEGAVVLPRELLEVRRISDASSVVSLWVERPSVLRETDAEDAKIRFAGVMPGGYSGRGQLFSITLKAERAGSGRIEVRDMKMFLNDGLGTPVDLLYSPFVFEIVHEEVPLIERRLPTVFVAPPEPFTPVVSRDASVFDGQWFVAFATQDKTSGIAYYEIRESKRKIPQESLQLPTGQVERPEGEQAPYGAGKTDAKWLAAESPYLLKDQSLRSYIYVKATNNDGKYRIEVLEPANPLRWYEFYEWWVIIILIIIIAVLRLKWRRRY